MYYVYKHTNKLNNKVYIGITKQLPQNRWKNGNGYKESTHFYAAILKYGWDQFEHEILFEGLTREEACEKEIELIHQYKSNDNRFGYNIMEGGTAPSLPQEVKDKIGKGNKGKGAVLGHETKEETKRKISLAQKGRKFSQEHKDKISKAKKGKKTVPCSEEKKEKISKSHKKKMVLCVETNVVFESIHKAAKELGIDASTICACCKNRIKSYRGLHFKYFDT